MSYNYIPTQRSILRLYVYIKPLYLFNTLSYTLLYILFYTPSQYTGLALSYLASLLSSYLIGLAPSHLAGLASSYYIGNIRI